jgi:hypothetical protein
LTSIAALNDAGVAVFKPIAETALEEWRQVLATHLDDASSWPHAARR